MIIPEALRPMILVRYRENTSLPLQIQTIGKKLVKAKTEKPIAESLIS
jgi:hypothetical protein